MLFYLFPIAAFLLGSIPFGMLIANAKKVDLRSQGSGNIGATNVFRVIGKKEGLLCFFLDFLKGFIPVILAINMLGVVGKDPLTQWDIFESIRTSFPAEQRTFVQTIHVISGLAAILGHNFSPWLKFKGGKGIATSAGVLFSLMPVGTCILFVVWAIFFFTTKYVAVASIAASIALPLIVLWGANHHHLDRDPSQPTLWESGTYNKPLLLFALVSGALAVWQHRSNIKRLMAGTENRASKSK